MRPIGRPVAPSDDAAFRVGRETKEDVGLRSIGTMQLKRHAGLALMVLASSAAAQIDNRWRPDGAFVHGGRAQGAHMVAGGLIWNSDWRREVWGGDLSLYVEAALGRWSASSPQGRDSAWVTQIGFTPVLRYRLDRGRSPWFFEAGIGVNLIAPVYESRDKRFSTTFNFGDHLAVGRSMGAQGQHEWALRIQHFSNAGIDRPNPGEDFLQLRYAWRFD